jgi:prevent-host-death family protein
MSQVNMHEAKTHLSRLVARALEGEDIVIARAGKPLVRIVPVTADVSRRRQRPIAGLDIKVLDSVFFDPLPDDELDAWSQ